MFNNNYPRELMIDSDDDTVCSFDSSQVYSLASRTASIDSICNPRLEQIGLRTPPSKRRSTDQIYSERTISIEKPRIQIKQPQQLFQRQPMLAPPPFQLCFVMGKKKKNIDFNQSKMKRVQNFFEDSQNTFSFNDDLFPNHSLMQFPKMNSVQQLKQDSLQFSIPCFKNMGQNKTISVNKEMLEKAKNFFNDDTQQILQPSFKKPTKVKKTSDNLQKQSNFIKTVNLNKKLKKQEAKKVKKQIFDWEKYQKSSKKLLQNQLQCFKVAQQKNHSKSKQKKQRVSVIDRFFEGITLQDLNLSQYQNAQKIQQFKQKKNQLKGLIFHHVKKQCKIPKCLLCDLSIQESQIDAKVLQQIFSSKLVMDRIQSDKFANLLEQVQYKLLKYDIFYPQIVNKRLNPSNILIEMHKKSKTIELGMPCLGWIEFCVKENKFYHSFIAQTRQIYHNQKINTFFLLLSDGWTNVWVVIPQKNYLYKFTHKLKLFSKLFIGFWKHYPLANILSFCPKAKPGQKCIEIWFNSSIIVKQNMKIGKPRNLFFYRPLNLNRKQGGMIPTVQGFVVRMFCISSGKKKSSNFTMQSTFSQNFIQIMCPQGYTVLIKFILPSDRTLAELFRLYFRYHFYFLKIGPKDGILQFNEQFSKFYEFDKKDKNSYQPQLVELIKSRYINSMTRVQLVQSLKMGRFYDVRIQNNKLQVLGHKFIIQADNQVELTNSFLKRGSFLYQQYKLQRVQQYLNKFGRQQLIFYLRKCKYSNILKSLPSIYQKLGHSN